MLPLAGLWPHAASCCHPAVCFSALRSRVKEAETTPAFMVCHCVSEFPRRSSLEPRARSRLAEFLWSALLDPGGSRGRGVSEPGC